MSTNQLLALLLALSLALNLGFLVGAIAKSHEVSIGGSVLVALGVAIPALGVYFAAVAAYHH
ncbi:hypothetical protein [Nocardia sp. NPDC051570]|uniref:hypothetical protein n=1 Tax=Nocardia sp. NPDC051570 TaxID=3364324 RepID=UPI00379BDE5D